jgi:hypothetical protein
VERKGLAHLLQVGQITGRFAYSTQRVYFSVDVAEDTRTGTIAGEPVIMEKAPAIPDCRGSWLK